MTSQTDIQTPVKIENLETLRRLKEGTLIILSGKKTVYFGKNESRKYSFISPRISGDGIYIDGVLETDFIFNDKGSTVQKVDSIELIKEENSRYEVAREMLVDAGLIGGIGLGERIKKSKLNNLLGYSLYN